jgi:hypothetical protein
MIDVVDLPNSTLIVTNGATPGTLSLRVSGVTVAVTPLDGKTGATTRYGPLTGKLTLAADAGGASAVSLDGLPLTGGLTFGRFAIDRARSLTLPVQSTLTKAATVALSVTVKDSRGRKTLARLKGSGKLKARGRATLKIAKATAKLKPGSRVTVQVVATVGKTVAGVTSATLTVPRKRGR